MTTKPYVDPDAGKSPEQLTAERTKRVMDAIAMQKPDRIPIMAALGYALAEWGGITRQELHDNPVKYQEVLEKFGLQMQADSTMGVFFGPAASKILGDQMTKWPGYGLDENGSFQFAEKEFMKPEDYEPFLNDPSDWTLRTYLPRAFSKLGAFANLPPFAFYAFGFYALSSLMSFASPPMGEALQAIGQAIQALGAGMGPMMQSIGRQTALGLPFPSFLLGALIEAPFDFMSDTLRGMRGIMLDIHKRPDQLLAAEEKVLKVELEVAIQTANLTGLPMAGIPLHRGSDGFMSLPQFEKFYWPQLKRLIQGLADNGISSIVVFEGVWDQRLEYLTELPKGKVLGMFQSSDIFKVKEVVGNTMAIMGGMPNSMLSGGTVEQIRARTKEVCEKVGKDGGFIMSTGIMELEGAKIELVKAWVDATKEFGVY